MNVISVKPRNSIISKRSLFSEEQIAELFSVSLKAQEGIKQETRLFPKVE
jgi:hypothetical protein